MVTHAKQHSSETPVKQGRDDGHSEPNKIGASTSYDFSAKNLTPYGGLLPVATMLEDVPFLVEIRCFSPSMIHTFPGKHTASTITLGYRQ
jgi:hypothetical protein